MSKMFIGFNPMRSEDADLGGEGSAMEDVIETGEEEMEAAEPSDEEGVEEQEAAEPAEDRKSDAAFAQMRRELEAEKKRADELEEALGLWFEGDNKAAQAHAHYEDIPLEEAIGNMEQKRALTKLEAEKAELEDQLQRLQFDNLRAEDLKEIKNARPDVKIKDVMELGDEFFQYRAMGIDPVTVYDALQLKKGVPPKPIGKAKTGAPAKTGFFTRDEVAAMSPSQISKNFDKIRESMGKWK